MLDIFTVSSFGHRRVDRFRDVELQVKLLVRKLLEEKEYVDFLVGRNGDFDQIIASAVRREREYYPGKCSLIWVMPYKMAEYIENMEAYENYYDEVEICSESDGAYPKAAYQLRNRSMVDRSDLIIFNVTHDSGGAYQTMKYAQSIGKQMINIAELL